METPKTQPTQLRTKHLAAKFGLKQTHLRRILRSMPRYADGVHTNYRWNSDDSKSLAEIKSAIDAQVKRKADAAAEAKRKLAERKAATEAQAATDRKAA